MVSGNKKAYSMIGAITLSILLLSLLGINFAPIGDHEEIHRELNIATVPFADKLPYRDISSNLWQICTVISDNSGDQIQDALPSKFTLKTYVDIASTGTQGALVTNDLEGYVVIVFRSSENEEFNDWLTNISIGLTSPQQLPGADSKVEIHSGFQNAVISNGVANLFGQDVMELLNDESLDFTKVYVTGHSLGGKNTIIYFLLLANPNLKLSIICYFSRRTITFNGGVSCIKLRK